MRVERTKDGVKLSSGDNQELAWLIVYQRAISKLIAVLLSMCLWVFGSR